MKTKLFYFIVLSIVIGLTLQSFTISPDKNNRNKTKIANFLLTPPPPSPWLLKIEVTDPFDTSCAAYNHTGGCNLAFFLIPAGSNCKPISATPNTTIPIVWGQSSYSIYIPDSIPCVQIQIVDVPLGSCGHPFNTIPCCTCRGGNPCSFKICL